MMRDRVIIRRVLLCLATVLLVSVSGQRVCFAESRRSISITPAKVELTLKPGSTWEGEIRVEVDNVEGITARFQVVDFKSREDETNIPLFFEAEPTETRGILSRWIQIDTRIPELTPNEFFSAPVYISIPLNADPGGYYGAVLFHTGPSEEYEESTSSGTAGAVASLFLVTVPGDVQEEGELVEFYLDKDFYETPPVQSTVRFRNNGTVHVRPTGQIEVYNVFNRLVGKIPVNPDLSNVLPGGIRRFEDSWGSERSLFAGNWFELPIGRPFLFGKYRAELDLWYGQEQKTVQASTYFWVIPWRFILVVWVLLLIFFYLTRKFHLRYMRWIWKKAKTLRWRAKKD